MKTNPERLVLGFVKFLGTPLCIAALLAAMVAFTRARAAQWEPAALAAAIALGCGGAGFGAIWWVRFHARATDPSERLRAANPGAPWMWREDWARGEVRTSARRDANRLTIFAIAWCSATFPILFIVPHRAIRSADYFAIPSLILPLAGVVMLAWAMRMRRRNREYGESRFAMAFVPGQIGGSISGSIQADKALTAGQQVALELACIKRTTRGTWHSPNDLGLDFVARRADFDERFDGIDCGRVPDRIGLPPDRRFESKEPNRVASQRAGARRWRWIPR